TALVVKQARELGFKGGFMLMDQAKMDEMARVLGGYELLEGSIGTMPLVADSRDSATAFVERYRKMHGADKDPTSEMSLNYTATHLIAEAMKLAGTVSDPHAIRAKADEAAGKLDAAHNPNEIDGVAENGAFKANVVVGFVDQGKVQQVRPSETAQNGAFRREVPVRPGIRPACAVSGAKVLTDANRPLHQAATRGRGPRFSALPRRTRQEAVRERFEGSLA